MVGIKAGHTNAERQLVAGLAGARLLEGFFQAAEENFVGLGGRFRGQDDKFITAKASENVGIAEGVFEGVGGADEGQIAFLMAEGVVNQLEVVDVAIEQQETLGIAGRELELLGGGGEKTAAVVETSEIIGKSEIAQLPVQQGLLEGGPDGGVVGNPERLRVRGVGLEGFGNFIHLLEDLPEVIVRGAQSRRQDFLEARFRTAVSSAHGKNSAAGGVPR